jgi:hypothetical protein
MMPRFWLLACWLVILLIPSVVQADALPFCVSTVISVPAVFPLTLGFEIWILRNSSPYRLLKFTSYLGAINVVSAIVINLSLSIPFLYLEGLLFGDIRHPSCGGYRAFSSCPYSDYFFLAVGLYFALLFVMSSLLEYAVLLFLPSQIGRKSLAIKVVQANGGSVLLLAIATTAYYLFNWHP